MRIKFKEITAKDRNLLTNPNEAIECESCGMKVGPPYYWAALRCIGFPVCVECKKNFS